jgi:hemin uptake protein HemP
MTTDSRDTLPAQPSEPEPRPAPKELWYSEELFGTRREVLIKHGDEIYRLRCTRQGKLILNK